MRCSIAVAARFARATLAISYLTFTVSAAQAQVWIGPSGTGDSGSWATPANWNPATVPNAVGASATFNSPPASRTVTIDSGAAGFTVAALSLDLASGNAFTNAINTGATGSKLIFDNGGSGATIATSGAGTGNNTFNAPLVFNDVVTGIVNQTTSSSAAGSLNLVSAISGTGGFTKQGDGLATFGTNAKTYTGPTVLSGGRTRISSAARPQSTSSLTINAGAQLDMISAASYTFGSGNLNLNGSGATSGPFAVFPGAIRNDTGLLVSITNNVVLQTDSLIHVQATGGTGGAATPTGSTTLSGVVSGPGRLTLTAPNSNIDQGLLILSNSNTYSGGSLVAGGILQASAPGSTFGAGDVTVDNTSSPSSIARVQILSGVNNAIADTASLSLLGGGAAGVADQNFAVLGAGVNETVFRLVLGGVAQAPGTYGSTTSGATFQNDEYFSGSGVITVGAVPEPGTMVLVGAAAAGIACRIRRRRQTA